MKKIGLTLDDKTYEKIVEIAKNNKMTPTTICGLILKLRCQWYESKEATPVFNQVIYENMRQTTSHNSETVQEEQELTPEEIQANIDAFNEVFGDD